MIEVKNVSKYYSHHQKAVDNLSFSVPKGTILGFLGPNGAGKTTTMRMITGFMAPSEGKIEVAGYDTVTHSMEARKRIGYLPETPPLYQELTVRSYLDFVARLKGIQSAQERKNRIAEVAESCWIGDVLNKSPGKLSKGYRQRVGLAQAIIHNPEVIILDEPTIGLDPKQIQETRKLIKSLGGQHTLILSTHILPEVQMTCDHVIIINKGKILAQDTPSNLIARSTGLQHIQLEIRGPEADISTVLSSLPEVEQLVCQSSDGDLHRFQLKSRRLGIQAELARRIVAQDWGLMALETASGSLEDVFIQLVTKEGGAD
jgi:ABC-2 type transport system ATP-binding protein